MTANTMDAAIAAAQALAAQDGGAAVAPANAANTAVAQHQPAGTQMTMETMSSGSLAVDAWLKVDENGFKIGDSSGLIASNLIGTIDMVEQKGFIPCMVAKAGNPATYIKTTDGVLEAGGQPWATELANLRLIDAKVRPYNSVTIAFTLTEDVKNVKNEVVAQAGMVLGFSTSTTNWQEWFGFYNSVKAAGDLGNLLGVELHAIPKVNAKKNQWGIVGFKSLGLAGE